MRAGEIWRCAAGGLPAALGVTGVIVNMYLADKGCWPRKIISMASRRGSPIDIFTDKGRHFIDLKSSFYGNA